MMWTGSKWSKTAPVEKTREIAGRSAGVLVFKARFPTSGSPGLPARAGRHSGYHAMKEPVLFTSMSFSPISID